MKKITFILMFCISFFMADALFAFDYEGNPKGEPIAIISPESTPPIPTRFNAGSPQRELILVRGATLAPTCGPGTVLTQTPYNEFEGYPRPDPTCQIKR
jgi:hypothetical protein